jgi:hypothetical protein
MTVLVAPKAMRQDGFTCRIALIELQFMAATAG